MGFFSKLKKALPYVEKAAVIAGQAQGSPVGAALATVELIVNRGKPVPGHKDVVQVESGPLVDAVTALAVAVDDHEARFVEIEKALKKLTKK